MILFASLTFEVDSTTSQCPGRQEVEVQIFVDNPFFVLIDYLLELLSIDLCSLEICCRGKEFTIGRSSSLVFNDIEEIS